MFSAGPDLYKTHSGHLIIVISFYIAMKTGRIMVNQVDSLRNEKRSLWYNLMLYLDQSSLENGIAYYPSTVTWSYCQPWTALIIPVLLARSPVDLSSVQRTLVRQAVATLVLEEFCHWCQLGHNRKQSELISKVEDATGTAVRWTTVLHPQRSNCESVTKRGWFPQSNNSY